jgi:DNA-binding transcriptional LysR family regulator
LSTEFATAAPDTPLHFHEATTVEQVRRLATGDLDVGLVRQPFEASTLCLGPTVAIAQGVVMARTSALAERHEISLDELTGQQLILFPRSAAPESYDEVLRVCRTHGFEPRGILHAANTEFVLGLVASGGGVAFELGATASKEPRVQWRPLVGNPVSWRVTVAWPAASAHEKVPTFAAVADVVLSRETAGAPLAAGSSLVESGSPRPWTVVVPTWNDSSRR